MLFTKFYVRLYIILLILIPEALFWSPLPQRQKLPVCRTSTCSKRAYWYSANMEALEHPCYDFYQFACGSWERSHPKPDFYVNWSVQQYMTYEAQRKIKEILRHHVDPDEGPLERRVKAAYQFCIDRPRMPKGSIKEVFNSLMSINDNLQKSVWLYHDTLLAKTGDSAFFSYIISVNEVDNYMAVLEIYPPESIYGSIYHIAIWTEAERNSYALFLEDIYRAYYAVNDITANLEPIRNDIYTLIEFREELNKIALEHALHKPSKSRAKKVSEVQEWYDMIRPHSKLTHINWDHVILSLYGELAYVFSKERPIMAIRTEKYFVALAELLSVTPVSTIFNHIQMYFVERQLIYTDRMKEKLENAISVSSKQTGIMREEAPRWLSCLNMGDMAHEIGKIFTKAFFNKNTIKPVEALFKDLKNMLIHEVVDSWWLNGESRSQTIKQVNTVKSMIGYPEWYFNAFKKVDPVLPSPLHANAVFDTLAKKLYVAANLIRSPIFETAVPYVLNIGALGSTIGHELYHAFGDCGVSPGTGINARTGVDERKYLLKWRPEMKEICEQKKKCFINMYNNYARAKLAGIVNPDDIDATRTFIEDVADVMGLQLAYKLYKYVTEKEKRRCETIPLFDDYSCDQMFYIAYANSMCGSSDAAYLKRKYKSSIYNERSIRINGAVMNDRNFAKAFSCPPNSPMNPVKKCHLWH